MWFWGTKIGTLGGGGVKSEEIEILVIQEAIKAMKLPKNLEFSEKIVNFNENKFNQEPFL